MTRAGAWAGRCGETPVPPQSVRAHQGAIIRKQRFNMDSLRYRTARGDTHARVGGGGRGRVRNLEGSQTRALSIKPVLEATRGLKGLVCDMSGGLLTRLSLLRSLSLALARPFRDINIK